MLAALPLPGAAPELLVVVVVAYALAEGPFSGAVTGFVAGLLADLLADHALGRLALVLAVVGYLAGQVHDGTERSTLLPFAVVAAAAAGAVLLYAAEGVVLGDPRIDGRRAALAGQVGPLRCGPDAVRGPARRRLVRRVDAGAAWEAGGRR